MCRDRSNGREVPAAPEPEPAIGADREQIVGVRRGAGDLKSLFLCAMH
jgi:hypothetical protein